MACLWSNRNTFKTTIQNALCTYMQQLQESQISNLINTASSEFVCNMFVVDVNEIKSSCYLPWGIKLNNVVQLHKYVKRVFDDTTVCGNVKHYMSQCRCCSNELFFTALLIY